jgi:hypothetical protein
VTGGRSTKCARLHGADAASEQSFKILPTVLTCEDSNNYIGSEGEPEKGAALREKLTDHPEYLK